MNCLFYIQVLNEEEHLQEDDLVLIFRKRNVQSKTYENYIEKIFSAPKEPKINDLKLFVLNAFGIKESEEGIELAKYVSHEFNWLHFHLKYFEELQKKKKTGKKKKKSFLQFYATSAFYYFPFQNKLVTKKIYNFVILVNQGQNKSYTRLAYEPTNCYFK